MHEDGFAAACRVASRACAVKMAARVSKGRRSSAEARRSAKRVTIAFECERGGRTMGARRDDSQFLAIVVVLAVAVVVDSYAL